MALCLLRDPQRYVCASHMPAHARTCACRAAAAVAAELSPALSARRAGSPPVLLLPAGDAGRRGGGAGLASRRGSDRCRASGERRPAGGAGAAGAEALSPDCGRGTAGENASPGDRYSSDRMTASWRGDSSGDISPALCRAEQRTIKGMHTRDVTAGTYQNCGTSQAANSTGYSRHKKQGRMYHLCSETAPRKARRAVLAYLAVHSGSQYLQQASHCNTVRLVAGRRTYLGEP
jgi:hypothetical protein